MNLSITHIIMTYNIQDRETGTVIDTVSTLEEAERTVEQYENTDKIDGNFTVDFYEIVGNE